MITPALILEIVKLILEIHLKNLEVIPKEEQEKAWVLFYRGLNVWLAMLEKMGNAMIAAMPVPPVVLPPAPLKEP